MSHEKNPEPPGLNCRKEPTNALRLVVRAHSCQDFQLSLDNVAEIRATPGPMGTSRALLSMAGGRLYRNISFIVGPGGYSNSA